MRRRRRRRGEHGGNEEGTAPGAEIQHPGDTILALALALALAITLILFLSYWSGSSLLLGGEQRLERACTTVCVVRRAREQREKVATRVVDEQR